MLKNILLHFPTFYLWLRKLRDHFSGNADASYPRVMNHELERVAEVILSPSWNIAYGSGLMHEKLEVQFADYVGSAHAVAVGSGGVALQMSIRALGLKPGDEVIHQVDTCVANAFSVINAMTVPIFADISPDTMMLSRESITAQLSPATKAIIPVHMWGNAQDMELVMDIAQKNNLVVIEDACLALGAKWKDKMAGAYGKVGVFSFGCLKPIQTGEGGMIVTNDAALAKELRILRGYGEFTPEGGIRDNKVLSWNGRMSEILAAVALEQLKGYPALLNDMEENVSLLRAYLENVAGVKLVESPYRKAYTQVVLSLDAGLYNKYEVMDRLDDLGVSVWHANFEPINGLGFFTSGEWRNWILKGDFARIESNYKYHFQHANKVYQHTGMGISKNHFLTVKGTRQVIEKMNRVFK